jgi:hypothetical protein
MSIKQMRPVQVGIYGQEIGRRRFYDIFWRWGRFFLPFLHFVEAMARSRRQRGGRNIKIDDSTSNK